MKNFTRKILPFCLLVALVAVSACNTFEGMGEDVKNGGQDLESSAARNK